MLEVQFILNTLDLYILTVNRNYVPDFPGDIPF